MTATRPTFRIALHTGVLMGMLMLGACSDDPMVAAPRQTVSAKAPRSLYISSPAIALLGVEISGGELMQPLLYQFSMSDGQSKQSLSVPAGKGYTAVVRGYDRYGVLTHESSLGLENVDLGENRGIGLELTPVKEGETVKVSMGLVGEERAPDGIRISLRSERKSVYDGESVNVRATILDIEGKQIAIDPRELHWAIVDPRTGNVMPGKDMDASYAAKYLLYQNYASLVAVWRQIRIDIKQLVLFDPYVDVSVGSGTACGVKQSGRVYCWGSNSWNMLASSKDSVCASFRCSSAPVLVESGTRKFSSVSVGKTHVCAVETGTGAAYCWGTDNGNLKMGGGAASGSLVSAVPVAVTGSAIAFKSISAGWEHTCGVSTVGVAYCWGNASLGRLGTPSGSAAGVPVAVSAPLNSAQVTYTSVTAGFLHSCGLATNLKIYCWGRLGNAGSSVPVEIPLYSQGGTTFAWAQLSQSGTALHSCATNGIVNMCWGDNASGQLGNGISGAGNYSATPVLVKSSTGGAFTTPLTIVATGEVHSCGLTSAGGAFCWGEGANGELGDGTMVGKSTPVAVGGSNFTTISAGSGVTCAVDTNGDIYCWGKNDWGQVGIGRRDTWYYNVINAVTSPTKIVAPI